MGSNLYGHHAGPAPAGRFVLSRIRPNLNAHLSMSSCHADGAHVKLYFINLKYIQYFGHMESIRLGVVAQLLCT